MDIHHNHFRLGLFEQSIRGTEGTIVVDHEYASLDIDDRERNTAATCALVVTGSGSVRRVVRRTEHPPRRASILETAVKIVANLFLIPNVIARGENVGA